MKRVLVALLAFPALASCGGSGDEFAKAKDACDGDKESASSVGITLTATDDAVTMRIPSDADSGTALVGVAIIGCLVDEFDGPSTIGDKVLALTPSAGTQTDTWDDYEASWGYTGSGGLQFIIEAK